ncbi:MAG: MBL fold metallo-hydrolase [Solirubrobacterales bacterium]
MEEPTKLAEGVVRLGTPMVNWYLVAGEEGVVVVDAGLPKYWPQLEPGLQLLGAEIGDVRAVLLTHTDGDHMGVAERLRSEHGVGVWVHPEDEATALKPRPKKTDGKLLPYVFSPTAYRLFWHIGRAGASPKAVKETRLYPAAGGALELPGDPVVIPTPGHTPGHVAIHFPSRSALFVGDAMCTWNPLTGRRGAQRFPSALNNRSGLARRSLAAIEPLEADLLLPGHGEPWTGGPAAAVAEALEAPAS